MAISRTQPMRPVEIDLLDHMDSAKDGIEQLQEDLEETNHVVGELSSDLDQEIVNRQQADTALGTRIDNETQARTREYSRLNTRLGDAENDIGTLQNDFAAFPVFEYGRITNEIAAGSSAVIGIEFQEEKTSTPCVLIGIECVETADGIIVAASNAGFSVKVYNFNTANDETITINWLAIGA